MSETDSVKSFINSLGDDYLKQKLLDTLMTVIETRKFESKYRKIFTKIEKMFSVKTDYEVDEDVLTMNLYFPEKTISINAQIQKKVFSPSPYADEEDCEIHEVGEIQIVGERECEPIELTMKDYKKDKEGFLKKMKKIIKSDLANGLIIN